MGLRDRIGNIGGSARAFGGRAGHAALGGTATAGEYLLSRKSMMRLGLTAGALFGVGLAWSGVVTTNQQEAAIEDRSPESGAVCTTQKFGPDSTGRTVLDAFRHYNPASNAKSRLAYINQINPAGSAANMKIAFCTVPSQADDQQFHLLGMGRDHTQVYDIYPLEDIKGIDKVKPAQFTKLLNGEG